MESLLQARHQENGNWPSMRQSFYSLLVQTGDVLIMANDKSAHVVAFQSDAPCVMSLITKFTLSTSPRQRLSFFATKVKPVAAASLASIPRCTRFECALPVVLGEALKAVHERVSNTMQAYCDIGDDQSYKIWKEALGKSAGK